MSFIAVSAGISAVGTAFKIGTGLHQNHLANQINPVYTPYQESPYAKQQLGLAQQLYNGRMFGASNMERNIANSQANYQNSINSNATDSAQALALGGLSQGITNNAYNNLQTQEAQNRYNLLDNLNRGYQAMVGEGDKVYQDKLQKYQMDTQQQAALRNAGFQNIFSGINDAAGTVAGVGQYNQQKQFNNAYLNILSNKKQQSFTPIDMNAITGGLSGNAGTLAAGNPFAVNTSNFLNPYGE